MRKILVSLVVGSLLALMVAGVASAGLSGGGGNPISPDAVDWR